jgi:hypothetical protein
MDFRNYELKHFQSQFERTVAYNLADSSVQCADVRKLLGGDDAGPLVNLPLFYPEVNGTALLRERIGALYPRAAARNVLVTVGACQANSLVRSTLLEAGGRQALFFSSIRIVVVTYPKTPARAIENLKQTSMWNTGLSNIWHVGISSWLEGAGLRTPQNIRRVRHDKRLFFCCRR